MEGRGEGEVSSCPPAPAPPAVPLRRNLFTRCNSCLPATVHVTPASLDGNIVDNPGESSSSSSKAKWPKIFASVVACIAIIYLLGITLDYYEIWDPCSVRFRYQTQCYKGIYAAGLIHKAEYVEDSLCLIPGIFHTSRSSGWNIDCTEHPELAPPKIDG